VIFTYVWLFREVDNGTDIAFLRAFADINSFFFSLKYLEKMQVNEKNALHSKKI